MAIGQRSVSLAFQKLRSAIHVLVFAARQPSLDIQFLILHTAEANVGLLGGACEPRVQRAVLK